MSRANTVGFEYIIGPNNVGPNFREDENLDLRKIKADKISVPYMKSLYKGIKTDFNNHPFSLFQPVNLH